jgi:hypothetical protein
VPQRNQNAQPTGERQQKPLVREPRVDSKTSRPPTGEQQKLLVMRAIGFKKRPVGQLTGEAETTGDGVIGYSETSRANSTGERQQKPLV